MSLIEQDAEIEAGASSPAPPLSGLRKLMRRENASNRVERCELCGAALHPEHQHLLEPDSRRLACACDACSLLFDGRTDGAFRCVPRDSRFLADFALTDLQWDDLLIPINMAFFYHGSAAGRVVAMYPSPAGPMESLLPLEAWQSIVDDNPVLTSMQPDVEALLVNRLGAGRGFESQEYYLVPISEAFKLVGLIRTHWRGLSGGDEVWREIAKFFAQLRRRSVRRPKDSAVASGATPIIGNGLPPATGLPPAQQGLTAPREPTDA